MWPDTTRPCTREHSFEGKKQQKQIESTLEKIRINCRDIKENKKNEQTSEKGRGNCSQAHERLLQITKELIFLPAFVLDRTRFNLQR